MKYSLRRYKVLVVLRDPKTVFPISATNISRITGLKLEDVIYELHAFFQAKVVKRHMEDEGSRLHSFVRTQAEHFPGREARLNFEVVWWNMKACFESNICRKRNVASSKELVEARAFLKQAIDKEAEYHLASI